MEPFLRPPALLGHAHTYACFHEAVVEPSSSNREPEFHLTLGGSQRLQSRLAVSRPPVSFSPYQGTGTDMGVQSAHTSLSARAGWRVGLSTAECRSSVSTKAPVPCTGTNFCRIGLSPGHQCPLYADLEHPSTSVHTCLPPHQLACGLPPCRWPRLDMETAILLLERLVEACSFIIIVTSHP